ncbi:porin [Prochlorococcus marinus]|nr:porin [Prochlorococcus marinus]MBO8204244.1 porin [Prochlorococcus marinus CUG1415]MBW3043545.1 porin [Prochlorococcus marinus str. MU1415]
MKLFHKLLVAPATLGLLAPFSAVANEINLNQVTQYGIDQEELFEQDFDSNTFSRELAQTDSVLTNDSISGSNFEAGSFSETTIASFSADFLIGATEGDANTQGDPEAVVANYSFEIGLNTTFTGDDDLFVNIGSGNTIAVSPLTTALDFGNANADALRVKDVHYTRPFGDKLTVAVGDSLDISDQFTGACVYSGFTDVISDCGTGNSAGAGGDVTISTSYDIGNGFTLGAGMSGQEGSTTDGIFTKESNDIFGFQLAYAADSYGAALSYASADTPNVDTIYWGVNGYYSFDNAFLDSVSVGYEVGNPSAGNDAKAYFVGLTTAEVGPGAISLGLGTNNDIGSTPLIVDDAETTMLYEVSYSWNLNDATTATVGGFLQERDNANGEDLTGIALKTSFAF